MAANVYTLAEQQGNVLRLRRCTSCHGHNVEQQGISVCAIAAHLPWPRMWNNRESVLTCLPHLLPWPRLRNNRDCVFAKQHHLPANTAGVKNAQIANEIATGKHKSN